MEIVLVGTAVKITHAIVVMLLSISARAVFMAKSMTHVDVPSLTLQPSMIFRTSALIKLIACLALIVVVVIMIVMPLETDATAEPIVVCVLD